jgi:hypothetical protein
MKKPSRRAVVRTGVWAVPVVATAAVAPAFGRTMPPVDIEGMGSGRRLPGHSTSDGETFYSYRMAVTFDNNTTTSQLITLIDFTISRTAVTGFPIGSQLTLQPGATQEHFVVTSSASSQRTATITYEYGGNIHTKTVTFPDLKLWNFTSVPTPKDADPTDPDSICA